MVVVTKASFASSRHRHAVHVYPEAYSRDPCLHQFAAAKASVPGGRFNKCNAIFITDVCYSSMYSAMAPMEVRRTNLIGALSWRNLYILKIL